MDTSLDLGLDVSEGERPLVLVDDVGRNFLVDDLLEYGAHGRLSLALLHGKPGRVRRPTLDLAKLKCENTCA